MSDTKLDEAKSLTTSPERLAELISMSVELARAVAANPNAPPKLLQKLSKYNDLKTRQNVALNPNTTMYVLFKLGKNFPEEFLNNPILGLLLLENPNFLESVPTDTFIELLRVVDVPLFVEWGLKVPTSNPNYTNCRLAIASNLNTTKEVLLQLYNQSPKTNIAQVALLHVNWKGEITEDWDEAAFIEIRTCGYISRNKIKEQLLQELDIIPKHLRPYSENYRYIISLYKHSISTYKYLDLLNQIPFLSRNTYKIFENINNRMKSIDSSSRTNFLFFLLLPYWLTQNLIKYSVYTKRRTLILLFITALLSTISPPLAIILLKLILALIMITLILSLLTILGALFTLFAVIIVSPILIFLIFIANKLYRFIKNYKQKRLDRRQLSKYNSNIYKQDLETAINPNTSPRILFELASSRWLEVREAVAVNPNADVEVLKKLAQDESLKLQLLVAKHYNTPAEVLTEFAKSKSVEKKIAVAQNIKTPLSTLKYLALSSRKYKTVCPAAIKTIKQCYPEELTNILVEYVEKTPRPSAARLFLLLHETAPSDFLTRHYRSLDWRERYAVAQNPNTPINILEKLRLDANCIVRATAKARF